MGIGFVLALAFSRARTSSPEWSELVILSEENRSADSASNEIVIGLETGILRNRFIYPPFFTFLKVRR